MSHENAITLKQLRALAAIVDAGTLSAAAERLHVTTPAVSTQLRSLEGNVGTELLRRGPDGRNEPTAEGREILAAIDQIEAVLNLCHTKIKAVREGRAGHVALGVVSTGKYFAPGLVMRGRTDLPNVEIALTVGNREEIIAAMARRAIDFAIMGRPPREPAVVADVIGDHPHVVIAAPDHPLAAFYDVSPMSLLAETWLCREAGSGTRILMERILDRIGDGQPYRTIDMGSNETIKQAVIAGLGVALISGHTVVHELESRRLVTLRFPGLPIIRQWFLISRADTPLSPTSEAFRSFILGLGGGFLPRMPASG